MMYSSIRLPQLSSITLAICALAAQAQAQAQQAQDKVTQLETVVVKATAEEEVKRSLGVSVITAQDLEKNPPAADLSEVLRREPGVNLTGSAASGMRGNRRQLDIRGMGPDNTLVLIDGRPATSRNASRQGWTGERDTDGDTNWVPAEAIDKVEILRGPAAARYGSGAMGGVVNIITKRPTDKYTGSVTYYGNFQQDSKEGDTNRMTFNLAGPLSQRLGFRLYGGVAETDPDAIDINKGHAYEANGIVAAAGKTDSRDRNVNGVLTLDVDPQQKMELNLGFSRKSDLYSGDTQNLNSYSTGSGGNFIPVTDLYGSETTVVKRSDIGLTHKGSWGWGSSRTGFSYTETRNSRATEGLFGGPEGAFLSDSATSLQQSRYTTKLQETRLDGEVNLPLRWFGASQMLTLGAETKYESLNDPGSTRTLRLGSSSSTNYEPVSLGGRSDAGKLSYSSFAVYAEDNIGVGEDLILTPAMRVNQHEKFGNNLSPGVTASYSITPDWTLKGGVARAYKTPNLYQANPNYLLYSAGNGCRSTSAPCYLQGNDDLKAETSVNKELGIAYDAGSLRASLAYFHNSYKNKITAGVDSYGTVAMANGSTAYLLKWENTPKAVVSGLEGNLFVPLTTTVDWNTNFTYMIESEDKTYHQPLSIIPEYTLNSSLDWAANDKLSVQSTVTWYGQQKPATYDIRRGASVTSAPSLSPYALLGISSGYKISKHYSVRAGINNLLDKKLYRTGLNYGTNNALVLGAGASTYNEHGRSFFVSLTGSF
ncbi:MAG: TonB-dependent siderophore receptor [Candidatus Dactylopiibacterium carminicum]|uniref:TonB-dependent siderophore receptor n=1 Tax=Candidatus Dactylopiibacterium carminicum TaxID=857335 RepID=A0A272EVP1_9RHOO|nr:FepA family TonB-dependent siderophore receptor [Candidatus Dactylopiibacterium carminicum]KAF7599883.1 TonB-dependent siderophore receptor [Candidatus Dactylopiibacterium carminicum]PAS94178.1 MAG: TonB-dependent siderophore receptor [Candidatus Dactylopiibacterium carminicum]PAS96750.1 MAG: TonB-dependent siderophore receptor [Candidatus Dactylopiibacterium carminicum]PAS99882.1 MAG: outer membrane receptor protein [Candidatus Dactylopiibacterium carminicum]